MAAASTSSRRRARRCTSSIATTVLPPIVFPAPAREGGNAMKRSPFVRLSRARLALFGRALPLSDDWGYSRGQPIDRLYISRFLSGNRDDIRGDVLEVKGPLYTRRYGRD